MAERRNRLSENNQNSLTEFVASRWPPTDDLQDDLKKRELKLKWFRLAMKEGEDLMKHSTKFKEMRDQLTEEETTLLFFASLPNSYEDKINDLISTEKALTLAEAAEVLIESKKKKRKPKTAKVLDGDNPHALLQVAASKGSSAANSLQVDKYCFKKRQVKLKLYRLKMKKGEDFNKHSEQFEEMIYELEKEGVKKEEEEITLLFLASLPDSYKKEIKSLIGTKRPLTLVESKKMIEMKTPANTGMTKLCMP